MKTKMLMILMFLVFVFISCEKDETSKEDIIKTKLLGSWEWMKTNDAFNQKITSPTTEGYSSTILFLPNDSVQYFIDKTFLISYPYRLVYRKKDFLNSASDSTLILQIDNGSDTFFKINHDTLILSQAYIDGPTEYYLKNKNKR